jgi:hypothetical protein
MQTVEQGTSKMAVRLAPAKRGRDWLSGSHGPAENTPAMLGDLVYGHKPRDGLPNIIG